MFNLLNRAKPYLKNCVSYGALFCGAELSQQLYIRKYQPTSQVKLSNIQMSSLDYCNPCHSVTLQGLQTEKLDTDKLRHLSGWGFAIGKESFNFTL